MLPAVAIATGDPSGIGPEISLKAALDPAARAMCRPILVGDRSVLTAHAQACGLSLEGVELIERSQFAPGELRIGEIKPAHGRAALDSAKAAVRAALSGKVQAVVAAPHNETAIHQAGIEFDGYPSFVARLCGLAPEDGILMLCFQYEGREIRIAHVTLHTSVATALRQITAQRVARTIHEVAGTLRKLGIARPRLGVSGVNPHAGENGLFGDDEINTLKPALAEARASGIDVDDPIGADILIQKKGYDAYVVMLHDQGHIAAKLLAPQRVAGMTIGTPVLFSSVAHGSAHDIAGKNLAKHGAMLEAIARVTGSSTLRQQPAG
jgi:4-hydroxy-L-threonine phosphate dehydrogenase PdxA